MSKEESGRAKGLLHTPRAHSQVDETQELHFTQTQTETTSLFPQEQMSAAMTTEKQRQKSTNGSRGRFIAAAVGFLKSI